VSVGALVSVVAVGMAAGGNILPDRTSAVPRPPPVADAMAEVPRVTPQSQQEKVRNSPPPPPPEPPNVRESMTWRESTALGLPMSGGQLVDGVQLPSSGPGFSTWDPVLKRVPNRTWRRYGHDDVVRKLLTVIDNYRETFPDAPPLLIGDLSRPRGGDFGPRWGSLGHVSHQNGLDVDVYYPRTDGKLVRATTPSQVNPRIAQWLVDQFVATRPQFVFTGPSLNLTGPPGVVQALANHDDHLHIRYFDPD
jgi:hypothetical protein